MRCFIVVLASVFVIGCGTSDEVLQVYVTQARVEAEAARAAADDAKAALIAAKVTAAAMSESGKQAVNDATKQAARAAEAASSVSAPKLKYETKLWKWKSGQPGVRTIHKDEGVVFISHVNGAFNGGGEGAVISLDKEGYWVVGGYSGAGTLHVWAHSVKVIAEKNNPTTPAKLPLE